MRESLSRSATGQNGYNRFFRSRSIGPAGISKVSDSTGRLASLTSPRKVNAG